MLARKKCGQIVFSGGQNGNDSDVGMIKGFPGDPGNLFMIK